jgi:predicted RNase H-like HicB family nuclease
MPIDYINAAMRRAKYKLLADDEGFVGTIPGFQGVIGHAKTLEACRDDLVGALQSWLLVKLRQADSDVPVIDRINLSSVKPNRKVRGKSTSQKAA